MLKICKLILQTKIYTLLHLAVVDCMPTFYPFRPRLFSYGNY